MRDTLEKIKEGCVNVLDIKDLHNDAKSLAKEVIADCEKALSQPDLEAVEKTMLDVWQDVGDPRFPSIKPEPLWVRNEDGKLELHAPPQREWQGLTDEEIEQGNKESWVTKQAWESAVWWAEAKLKEKNT